MLTAYDTYLAAHEDLFITVDPEKFGKLSKQTVEAYLENRAIWEELNYFKKNGELLGKHPVFSELNEIETLRKLNSAELAQKRQNIYINIQKTKNELSKGDKPLLNAKREQSIKSKERIMAEIDNILKSR